MVLRGAARAVFTADGEEVALDGSTATTWVERTITGVTRSVIELEESDETIELGSASGWCGSPASRSRRPCRRPQRCWSPRRLPAEEPWEAGVASEDLTGFEAGEPEPTEPDARADARAASGPTDAAHRALPRSGSVRHPSEAPDPGDHDGMTGAAGIEPDDFARQHPGIPASSPPRA